jgi:hypothetical protein
MSGLRALSIATALVIVALHAAAARIADEAAAVEAAKAYTKGRCTSESPCSYRARREAKQWNVWVQLTKRSRPGAAPSPAGHLILYFDAEGNLVRRIEGD